MHGVGLMNIVKVDGLPISRLKETYLVIIVQSKKEFEGLLNSQTPAFLDDQKIYSIQDKTCYVFFHKGEF